MLISSSQSYPGRDEAMYERGEAGPRPNPKLLNCTLREGYINEGHIDIGYVNGVPYGLTTAKDKFSQSITLQNKVANPLTD
jgi:hypothetical protein